MSISTSYSQNTTYKQCSKLWDWKYNYGLEPEGEGASLWFGSAIDDAITAMLEGKDSYLTIFSDKWFSSFRNKQPYNIFDNLDVNYAYSDFDELVFNDEDFNNMKKWCDRLNLDDTDPIQTFKEVVKIKKNPYKNITENQLRYFSRCCWLSLKRKGELLIESFKEQVLPKIKKVHSTQGWGKIEDDSTGDKIVGKLDMVLDFEGYDKPIIFDLKTSARPYTQEQIELTEQLTLYAAMLGKNLNTNLVGYIVLVKNIPKVKEEYCSICGHKKEGRHKTCNSENSEGKRCNGEWTKVTKHKPEVQIMVKEKSQEQIDQLLLDYGNIIYAMKEKIVYKNTEKCNNWYGSVCPYYDACHKNDFSKLRKKDRL